MLILGAAVAALHPRALQYPQNSNQGASKQGGGLSTHPAVTRSTTVVGTIPDSELCSTHSPLRMRRAKAQPHELRVSHSSNHKELCVDDRVHAT